MVKATGSKRHPEGVGICTGLSNGVSEDVYINIDLLGGGNGAV